MSETEIDRVKISKDLLNGIEVCSKQLSLMKSQLDIFLSDDKNQIDDQDISRSKQPNKRRKLTSGAEVKASKIRKTTYVDELESDVKSTSTNSNNSKHSKDKNFKDFPPSKVKGSFVKRFATDQEDKLYKPHGKKSTKVKNVKANDKKNLSEGLTAKNTRGRPKKASALRSTSDNEKTNDDSSVLDKTVDSAEYSTGAVEAILTKKVRGRPLKFKNLNSFKGGKENISTEKRGRGRPLKKLNMINKELSTESEDEGRETIKETLNNSPIRSLRGTSKINVDCNGDKSSDIESINNVTTETSPKKGRGRSYKKLNKSVESGNEDSENIKELNVSPNRSTRAISQLNTDNDGDKTNDEINVKANKGRGRPSKVSKLSNGDLKKGRGRRPKVLDGTDSSKLGNVSEGMVASTPMKRGRPPKFVVNESVTIIEN